MIPKLQSAVDRIAIVETAVGKETPKPIPISIVLALAPLIEGWLMPAVSRPTMGLIAGSISGRSRLSRRGKS